MIADLIGIPFKDGGRTLAGFDCYGLAIEVFRRYGIVVPEYYACCEDSTLIDKTITEARVKWVRCTPPDLPVPCLVVIRFNEAVMCNHTGVYIGNGRFIHIRQKIGVNIDLIDSLVWKRRIEGFYVPGKGALTCKI